MKKRGTVTLEIELSLWHDKPLPMFRAKAEKQWQVILWRVSNHPEYGDMVSVLVRKCWPYDEKKQAEEYYNNLVSTWL